MEALKKNFENCKDLLEQLKGPNLVLTGSCVLQAYGLYLHKEPEDLDIAIYFPTDEQMAVINSLKEFNIAKNEDIPDDYTRVTKLNLGNGTTVDIILEIDENNPNLLEDDEYLKYQGYNLQPVHLIIQARGRFARDKDFESCRKLKDLNFNMEALSGFSKFLEDLDDNSILGLYNDLP